MKTVNFPVLIITAITVFACLWMAENKGYKRGYSEGISDMFYATMDTVQGIINHQIKSDTSGTILTLEGKDTLTVIPTRKIMEDKLKE